jgi:hypothetical protein
LALVFCEALLGLLFLTQLPVAVHAAAQHQLIHFLEALTLQPAIATLWP